MLPLVFAGVSTYSLMLPLMIGVPVIMLLVLLRREGVSAPFIAQALLLLAVCVIGGAKLFSLANRGWPGDWFQPRELVSGWRFSGAVIGMALSMPLAWRLYLREVSLARLADIGALVLVTGMCIGRVACILAGCCTGAEGEGLLHLSYPPGSAIWYHQLQAGLLPDSQSWSRPVLALPLLFWPASLFAAVVMFRVNSRPHYHGQVAILFLVLHELPKAGLELLRVPVIESQLLAAALAGACGLLLLLFIRLSSQRRARAAAVEGAWAGRGSGNPTIRLEN